MKEQRAWSMGHGAEGTISSSKFKNHKPKFVIALRAGFRFRNPTFAIIARSPLDSMYLSCPYALDPFSLSFLSALIVS